MRTFAPSLYVLALGLFACAESSAPRPTAASLAPSASRRAAPTPMQSFTEGRYTLSGAEYWPYIGTAEEPKYPEEVLWGFYPRKGVTPPGETDPNADDATPAAVACAERAFAELRAFLASNPPALRAIVERGAARGFTPLFYLWVNDYTRASDPYPHDVRHARLWYWKRKVPDANRPAGYWKWESTLTRAGECQTPTLEQRQKVLADTLATM